MEYGYDNDLINLIGVIFNCLGAIATAASLIYLFVQDYKKSKRISDLEKVAQILQNDLQLKYQPHLWLNGTSIRVNENRINFDINNKREWCKLTDFKIVSGDLILDERNKNLPTELEPKFNDDLLSDTTRRYIFALNKSEKNMNDVVYEIEIFYEDRLGTKYSSVISGKGGSCKLSTPKSITNLSTQ